MTRSARTSSLISQFAGKPAERMPLLVAERNHKMAVSAHAYVRGSTESFYEWLEASPRADLPEGPPVWICGDCHLGNLGPVASAEGELAIQVRDLDQTVIGNPAHDLIRLALSLAMAARSSDLPGVTTAHMLERMIEGYQSAFTLQAHGKTTDAPNEMPKIVASVMREAAGRSWKHLADERIQGVERHIPLGRRFWPLTQEEHSAVDELFSDEKLCRLITSLRSRHDGARVRVMDAACWKKGCSSLGKLRLAVLVSIDKGKAERHCLIDVKEAIAPTAPHSKPRAMPPDNAERVIAGANNLSPFLGERMIAGTLLQRSVFVRELLPQDLKIEIEHLSRNEAMEVAEFLARVVGRGHARQMDRRFGSNGWPNLTVIGQSLSTHHPGFGTASWSLWLPMRLPICSTVADTRFPTPPELFQVIGGAAQRARRYQNLGAYRRGARAQATTKRQGALVQTPA